MGESITSLEHAHLRLRLLQCDLRVQSRKAFQEADCAPIRRWKRRPLRGPCHPNVCVRDRECKPGWQDTNDRVGRFIERGRLSNNLWIVVEAAVPQSAADQRHTRSSVSVLLGKETAPEDRLDSENA